MDVKTAINYKGAAIIFKVNINNNSPEPISDIKVFPYVQDVLLLKEKEKSIALIEPGSHQTATFVIRPTGECGDCNIWGRVNYIDEPIVQHFVHIGDTIGGDKIGRDRVGTQFKDNFIKNSNIVINSGKCPNCGMEHEANEETCKKCGEKL